MRLELTGFLYKEPVLKAVLAASPGTHEELRRQAQRVILKTQSNLSVPWPPPGTPGNPPHERTGLLKSSVKTREVSEDGLPALEVVADAQRRGWFYGDVLRNGTYSPTGEPFVFINETDLEGLKTTG